MWSVFSKILITKFTLTIVLFKKTDNLLKQVRKNMDKRSDTQLHFKVNNASTNMKQRRHDFQHNFIIFNKSKIEKKQPNLHSNVQRITLEDMSKANYMRKWPVR